MREDKGSRFHVSYMGSQVHGAAIYGDSGYGRCDS